MSYLTAIAAVAVTTAIGLLAFGPLHLADVAMLYLVAILVAATVGRGPTIVAASLAVLAFNFCFIPPRFTFHVAEARHLVTFAVMFGAGLTISTLITRLRREEARARSEELRSSLLSLVSHDLRTPLAVITGAATSLRDDAARLSEPARAELFDTLVGETRRLERVVANLLEMSRVETGIAPTREWIPVEELVGAALARVEPVLGDRAVVTEIGDDLSVQVDPVLFGHVLVNLLENAIKHGAPPFAISARRSGDEIWLEVADRGGGVPAAAAAHVFDKFFRASASPGAGLGLAVVRGLVDAHGGRIELVPSPVGARFRIALPAGELPAADRMLAAEGAR